MAEMARAIAGLKDGKAPGEVEFLLKYGSTEEAICLADCTNQSPMHGRWVLYHNHGIMPTLEPSTRKVIEQTMGPIEEFSLRSIASRSSPGFSSTDYLPT